MRSLSRVISSTQMVFTGLIACCFLGEDCGSCETLVVTLTLGGIIAVVQPEAIFGAAAAAEGRGTSYYFAAMVNVLGSVISSFGIVALR